MLAISESEVRELLPMNECIEILDRLFTESAKGGTANLRRHRLPLIRGAQQIMAGTSDSLDVTGLKTYVTPGKSGSHMMVLIYRVSTGEPLAILGANALGQIRTGAASGVATRYMSNQGSATVAIIGSGSQAITQLAAVCAVRPITKAKIYSRSKENRERFSREAEAQINIDVNPVETTEAALLDADVVCVITNSRDPVLLGEQLTPGLHVNAAGSNHWMRRELDHTAISTFNSIVVDDLEDAKVECGDLIWAAERRAFKWENVIELKEVVSGSKVLRGDPASEDLEPYGSRASITLFESQGIAIEDVAAGLRVYDKAIELGIGQHVDI